MDNQKTLPNLLERAFVERPVIFMSQEQKDAWLNALRSGEYKQASGTLYDDDAKGYCCLGLLEQVTSGECEGRALPSYKWLQRQNMMFCDNDAHDSNNPAVMFKVLPGDPENLGFIPSDFDRDVFHTNIAALNDAGYTFPQIADLLETMIEVL